MQTAIVLHGLTQVEMIRFESSLSEVIPESSLSSFSPHVAYLCLTFLCYLLSPHPFAAHLLPVLLIFIFFFPILLSQRLTKSNWAGDKLKLYSSQNFLKENQLEIRFIKIIQQSDYIRKLQAQVTLRINTA